MQQITKEYGGTLVEADTVKECGVMRCSIGEGDYSGFNFCNDIFASLNICAFHLNIVCFMVSLVVDNESFTQAK